MSDLSSEKRRRLRKAVIKRDGDRCCYCKYAPGTTLEHVIPRSRGGRHIPENLKMACEFCNNRRGNIPVEVFLQTNILKQRRRVVRAIYSPFTVEVM